jgi:ribosomal protein S18 acetylase RimI-like enzyme
MRGPHEARPDDPLVRWMVVRAGAGDAEGDLSIGLAGVSEGANVAWPGRATRSGERWVTGLGEDPSVVARLVSEVAEQHPVDGVTVTAEAFDALPTHLRSPDAGRWSFWTLDPADERLDSDGAVDIARDDPRIRPLLEHSDSAHVFPGDPRLVRWAGVEEGDLLVSVAGQMTEQSGAAHLVSVCTHPSARGRALARRACSRLIEQARAEGSPMVVLEMYSANDAGRRTYSALGFREQGRYVSGLLAHALPTLRS